MTHSTELNGSSTFNKQGGPVISVTCLQDANTIFRSTTLSFTLDLKILNSIRTEKIPDDHFCLDLTIRIALFRQRNIDSVIQIPGQLAAIARTHGIGYFIQAIIRAERNKDKRAYHNR